MYTSIIELFLKAIDQATFQKMMNHLLHLEGYKFIGSPGSVIGKNKTSKGSPDSFFVDGDNFAFCELTTQERLEGKDTFFDKLKKDVEHCFDTAKTGISKNKISKVILCFTEELTPSEFTTLQSLVQSHNATASLEIYSIQNIPFKILYYPGFGDKYIPGIKTTKGTLYTMPDFLQTTTKGIQPSLINDFAGREEELKLAETYLASADLLVLTGVQGVGKSKLGVQLLTILEKQGYEQRVIVSSPVPLWDDLQNFLLPDHKYAILFDDANKALPNLDYLLQFISQREAGSIKVIMTTRDYVRRELDTLLLDRRFQEIPVSVLKEDKLRDIIRGATPDGMHVDPLIIEKIIALSNGNARLALMALQSALDPGATNYLVNVAALYDQYFSKVATEASFIKDKQKLRALGILSFFQVIKRNNKQQRNLLETHFGMSWASLWETFNELEQSELVDLFADEVVKISDQVLSSYAFYKTFFDSNTASIAYDKWVTVFLKDHAKKIEKSLIDSINTFGFQELRSVVNSFLIKVQPTITGDVGARCAFYKCFWFYRETDTLLFIQDWINNLPALAQDTAATEETSDFSFSEKGIGDHHPVVELLYNFWRHDTPYTSETIRLGLTLLFKQPARTADIAKEMRDHFSFKRYDYHNHYTKQDRLFDALVRSDYPNEQQNIVDQLFLQIAGSFLGWRYHEHGGLSGSSFTFYTFSLIKTPALLALRKKILQRIFDLLPVYHEAAMEALGKYTWSGPDFDVSVFATEQDWFNEQLSTHLKPSNYLHAKIIEDYVERLNDEKIPVTRDWKAFLDTDLMKTARLFSLSLKGEDGRLSIDEGEKRKRQAIAALIAGKDLAFLSALLRQVESLYEANDNHYIETVLGYLFNSLADQDIGLYIQLVEHTLANPYKFRYTYATIIWHPLKQSMVNKQEFYQLINRYDYSHKQYWMQIFFDTLEASEITDFFFLELVGFIHSLNQDIIFPDFKQYAKFNTAYLTLMDKLPPISETHDNIIAYLAAVLLHKTQNIVVFMGYEVCQECKDYFRSNIALLKKIYLYQDTHRHHYDYTSKEIQAVCEMDTHFVAEYITQKASDPNFVHFESDMLKLDFVWDLPDYETVADQILEVIIAKEPLYSDLKHPSNIVFSKLQGGPNKGKALDYISRFIQLHHAKDQHVAVIMNVVTYSFYGEIFRFLRELLLLNKDPEILNHLFLYQNQVLKGSAVPDIEERLTFYQRVIDLIKGLPNPLEYAAHIAHFESEVEYLKKRKQDEMKRDFGGWDL